MSVAAKGNSHVILTYLDKKQALSQVLITLSDPIEIEVNFAGMAESEMDAVLVF